MCISCGLHPSGCKRMLAWKPAPIAKLTLETQTRPTHTHTQRDKQTQGQLKSHRFFIQLPAQLWASAQHEISDVGKCGKSNVLVRSSVWSAPRLGGSVKDLFSVSCLHNNINKSTVSFLFPRITVIEWLGAFAAVKKYASYRTWLSMASLPTSQLDPTQHDSALAEMSPFQVHIPFKWSFPETGQIQTEEENLIYIWSKCSLSPKLHQTGAGRNDQMPSTSFETPLLFTRV